MLPDLQKRAPEVDVDRPGLVEAVPEIPVPVVLRLAEQLLEGPGQSEPGSVLEVVTNVDDDNKKPLERKKNVQDQIKIYKDNETWKPN